MIESQIFCLWCHVKIRHINVTQDTHDSRQEKTNKDDTRQMKTNKNTSRIKTFKDTYRPQERHVNTSDKSNIETTKHEMHETYPYLDELGPIRTKLSDWWLMNAYRWIWNPNLSPFPAPLNPKLRPPDSPNDLEPSDPKTQNPKPRTPKLQSLGPNWKELSGFRKATQLNVGC